MTEVYAVDFGNQIAQIAGIAEISEIAWGWRLKHCKLFIGQAGQQRQPSTCNQVLTVDWVLKT